jgi:hypothetical protein
MGTQLEPVVQLEIEDNETEVLMDFLSNQIKQKNA